MTGYQSPSMNANLYASRTRSLASHEKEGRLQSKPRLNAPKLVTLVLIVMRPTSAAILDGPRFEYWYLITSVAVLLIWQPHYLPALRAWQRRRR
jgi:hypothetical protein